MRVHRFAVSLLLACACAPAAAAQTAVLRPGSADVSTRAITNRVDEFDVRAGGDNGETVGRMTLRTRLATIGGADVVVRTEAIWVDDTLVQLDSFTLHQQTLAPLAMRSSSTETGVEMEFTPGGVRQVDDGDWGADTSHVPLPEPVFAAGTTDLLLGSLPLAPGYRAELAVFDAEDGIDTIAIEVEAIEDVPLPEGGSVSALRVGVTENFLVSTYWMDRESRTLVQFESSDGSLRIVRSRGSRSRARPTR
jgi:hypothetical protein